MCVNFSLQASTITPISGGNKPTESCVIIQGESSVCVTIPGQNPDEKGKRKHIKNSQLEHRLSHNAQLLSSLLESPGHGSPSSFFTLQ